MELSLTAITELQTIYEEEFGINLTEDAVKAEVRRLLLFFYEFFLFEQVVALNSDLSTTPSSQER